MDIIDKKLLKILSENSAATATEISSLLNLSVPAVNKRKSKLKETGVIKKFTVLTDNRKVEKPIQAFVLLVTDEYSKSGEFLDFVNSQSDIIDCYAITGEYDYLIKITTKDIESLEKILLNLKEKRCVSKSQTLFSLMEHKHLPCVLPD